MKSGVGGVGGGVPTEPSILPHALHIHSICTASQAARNAAHPQEKVLTGRETHCCKAQVMSQSAKSLEDYNVTQAQYWLGMALT